MRTYRVRFSLVSSLGTPFQSDTLFGHICWAIWYLEGIDALNEFLEAYTDGSAPLLVSDGMPVIGDAFYVPSPSLPKRPGELNELASRLGIRDDVSQRRVFASACKAIDKKPWIEMTALLERASPLTAIGIFEDVFSLKLCPGSMTERDSSRCSCDDWRRCPALHTGASDVDGCSYQYPETILEVTMHNVINRTLMASTNLYAREDLFPIQDFYFLASLDESIFSVERFEKCLRYIEGTGYGRDKSTGCGAISEMRLEEWSPPDIDGANAFLNLSSAYVPEARKLPAGYYQIHVKRGKLGEEYVLNNSPWKKPILMIRAGAVFEGDPEIPHGRLVRNVHNKLSGVVQYGYAYPLGVKFDASSV